MRRRRKNMYCFEIQRAGKGSVGTNLGEKFVNE
jgi:hypothetical protein